MVGACDLGEKWMWLWSVESDTPLGDRRGGMVAAMDGCTREVTDWRVGAV